MVPSSSARAGLIDWSAAGAHRLNAVPGCVSIPGEAVAGR